VKVLLSLGHFWPRLPTVKVFVFHGHFWPRLLLLATLAMIPMMRVMFVIWDWATSGIPLYQTRIRVCRRQSLAPHCASRSSRSGRQLLAWDCKYKYTGRQPLARKYEYLVPWNGTC